MGKFRRFLKALLARDMPVFLLPDDNLSNTNGFLPNLVCALILWSSSLRLLMGKFCQFLTGGVI